MHMLITAHDPMANIHEIDLVRARLKPFCRSVNVSAQTMPNPAPSSAWSALTAQKLVPFSRAAVTGKADANSAPQITNQPA